MLQLVDVQIDKPDSGCDLQQRQDGRILTPVLCSIQPSQMPETESSARTTAMPQHPSAPLQHQLFSNTGTARRGAAAK
jgi:hypothetical protein